MEAQSLEHISRIVGDYLNPIAQYIPETRTPDEIYSAFIEPFLITLNSDESVLLALDEDEMALNLQYIMKEVSSHLTGLYNIEGAITASATFTFAPTIVSVSKYEALILKIEYESVDRICPTQIVNSFLSTAPADLKSRKNNLLQKLLRSCNQALSSDGYVGGLIKQSGKNIPNHKSLIRSIIPLIFLDQSTYFNETPKIQTPYQPHFYKC
jgi:hypothetical protein